MANPSTRKSLFKGVNNALANMGGAKLALAGAAEGAPSDGGMRASESGRTRHGAGRNMKAMAPCGKPAAAVAGSAAGAVAAPAAPGVKRDSTLEVMVASMVGTAIEFYDNYCYSIASILPSRHSSCTQFSASTRNACRRMTRCRVSSASGTKAGTTSKTFFKLRALSFCFCPKVRGGSPLEARWRRKRPF